MIIVCAVKDNVARCFSEPFYVNHIGAAIRSFIDAASNPKSNISVNIRDYDLYHIADFDPNNGEFCVLTDFELLCTGQSLAVAISPAKGQD